MADEKIYTIPMRKAYRGVRQKRAKRAIAIINQYLIRHMKADSVNIGKTVNESVWARGIQKPPRKVRIHAILDNKVAYAELVGIDIKTPSQEQVKEKDKKKIDKREKIKEERKERKKISLSEELDESGRVGEEVKEKESVPKVIPENSAK
ncbi:MAG: 50S ribosomal protein L31e [Nanoarchaeota archaeon]|nr:50S ribosomal protein L31e [Nanoarchaeota archaeon]